MPFRLKGERTLIVTERTSISLTRDDLAALAKLVQAGRVLLHDEPRPAVIARLKAAMTRLHVPVPAGL
jgi:hypothetical protein